MTGWRVIVADDHQVIGLALEAIFKDAGHRVIHKTKDAVETISAVNDLRPDVLLLDLMMPKGGGAAVLAAKAKGELHENTKIVILSANVNADTVNEVLENGADGYCNKATGVDEIIEVVAGVLDGERGLDRKTSNILLEDMQRSAAAKAAFKLTERETEVLQFVAKGLTNPEIAEKLFVARSTIGGTVTNIFEKLGAANRAEATAIAAKTGLLDS